MGLVWTPTSPLTNESVDTAVNKSLTAVYTPVTTEVVSGISVVWDTVDLSTWLTFTPSFTSTSASVGITGTILIDLFNQYSVTYVDKGQSNTSQTPVTTTIDLVPDFKEVYTITVDPRTTISVSFTVTVSIADINGAPLPDIINVFTFDVQQTYTNIKTWTDTYFSTRY